MSNNERRRITISVQKDLTQLDAVYRRLNSRAETLYDFVRRYNDYMSVPKDYGNGREISMTEVHMLTHIEENPGITITQLAREQSKTKSAVSQTVKKLETGGYIRREKRAGNGKDILLFASEEGVSLSVAHKLYDLTDIASTSEALLRTCTDEEINTFYKVIDCYRSLFDTE